MEAGLLAGMSVAVIILLTVCILGMIYFVRREKKTMERIQEMLDMAIGGRFTEGRLDESRLSAVENSMWRYLCDNQVLYERLSGEKERIQAQISDICHQAVMPVSNILLYAQLLEEWQGLQAELQPENRKEAQEAAEWVAAIREQAQELDFLAEALLKLSRLETGIIHVKMKKQKLQPILNAIQQQFMPRAFQKDVELLVENTEVSAVFDRNWTVEALANIVDNGIKYTAPGGRVSVRVRTDSFFVCVEIADNGMGIAEEEQANIFTRFYRSESVGDQMGLGIGLYLAREVMRAQNGYIKLKSEAGDGSLFQVFLLREEISQK